MAAGTGVLRASVPRVVKWMITLAVGAVVFAASWWVCDGLLAIDTGIALSIAAAPFSLVILPLAWWAGREPTPPTAPPGLAPPAVVPAAGQIVVGPVPREPQHFQRRSQISELVRLAESGAEVVCAITGRRGVGKTQLVGAYARQRITDGWLVAWIPSGTADAVARGLGELADALYLRHEGDNDARVLARLRSYLQTLRDPALLVFDNVTNPADVMPYLPATGSAQIVLTSANRKVEPVGTPVPVDLFTPDTAVRFLIDTTGARDEAGAHAVADKLGYLPLALAQAAARIAKRPINGDYTAYLHLLEEVTLDRALRAHPGDAYPRGAAEAILLAVEPFAALDTGGERRLLDLLSVLSPDGVSQDLLYIEQSPADVDDLLDTLFEASLVEFAGGTDKPVVVMHRLTQRALRDRANHDLATTLAQAAHLLDQAIFPEEQAWRQRDRGDELIRHIDTLWEHTTAAAPPAPTVHHVLDLRRWAVRQLTRTAFKRSIRLAVSVHTDHRRSHGDDHPDTLAAANNLAAAYRSAGWLDEAIPLFEQTLIDRRRVLGDDHPDTLASANNQAAAYRSAGRLDEAILLFEKTLIDTRRVLGDDHPNTLAAANNLAFAYEAAGRLDEAIPLFEKTLIDTRRVLGDDHPNTLTSANNVAYAYEAAGRLDEAIPLFEKTLIDTRRVLGDDNPDTLTSANNLAGAYSSAGRLAEAIRLFEKTLIDSRRVLGDDHPNTLTSANNLAKANSSVGRLGEAASPDEHTTEIADEPGPA